MTQKPSDSQRKSPKQSRSKELVEAIYEATVRILPKLGSQNITTKKIADLAGVNIGSLYQYFPNKESVLAGLMDLALRASSNEFKKKVDEIDGKTMEEATATMVDLALDLLLKEKEKNREIFRQAPELGRVPSLLKLRQSIVERLAEEMKKHHPGLDSSQYIRVSFIAVNSVMGVILTMLYDESQVYTVEELSAELKTLLNSYFISRKQG